MDRHLSLSYNRQLGEDTMAAKLTKVESDNGIDSFGKNRNNMVINKRNTNIMMYTKIGLAVALPFLVLLIGLVCSIFFAVIGKIASWESYKEILIRLAKVNSVFLLLSAVLIISDVLYTFIKIFKYIIVKENSRKIRYNELIFYEIRIFNLEKKYKSYP
ncbi:hypothetical protein MKS88_002624 [Plasmodium brasilianum]|uniref:Uncharacterized protein n=1 Tax=Plasmodium brasilianum TaxID=5824 RepID=A0ACB9YAH4_PLABR|nr:hypothetical protein MKS88_002624 [Plasmodium brasilianum]